MDCPHKHSHALHFVFLLITVILLIGNLYWMLR